jgi:hypothetical protein
MPVLYYIDTSGRNRSPVMSPTPRSFGSYTNASTVQPQPHFLTLGLEGVLLTLLFLYTIVLCAEFEFELDLCTRNGRRKPATPCWLLGGPADLALLARPQYPPACCR